MINIHRKIIQNLPFKTCINANRMSTVTTLDSEGDIDLSFSDCSQITLVKMINDFKYVVQHQN